MNRINKHFVLSLCSKQLMCFIYEHKITNLFVSKVNAYNNNNCINSGARLILENNDYSIKY